MTTAVIDPCGRIESSCVCALDADHAGPHTCSCGGSWTYKDDQFIVVTFPGGESASIVGMLNSLDRMLGTGFDD